eukprot:4052844-Amphidinium_carterae.1
MSRSKGVPTKKRKKNCYAAIGIFFSVLVHTLDAVVAMFLLRLCFRTSLPPCRGVLADRMQCFGRYPGWRGGDFPVEALLQDVVTPIPGCPGR